MRYPRYTVRRGTLVASGQERWPRHVCAFLAEVAGHMLASRTSSPVCPRDGLRAAQFPVKTQRPCGSWFSQKPICFLLAKSKSPRDLAPNSWRDVGCPTTPAGLYSRLYPYEILSEGASKKDFIHICGLNGVLSMAYSGVLTLHATLTGRLHSWGL